MYMTACESVIESEGPMLSGTTRCLNKLLVMRKEQVQQSQGMLLEIYQEKFIEKKDNGDMISFLKCNAILIDKAAGTNVQCSFQRCLCISLLYLMCCTAVQVCTCKVGISVLLYCYMSIRRRCC